MKSGGAQGPEFAEDQCHGCDFPWGVRLRDQEDGPAASGSSFADPETCVRICRRLCTFSVSDCSSESRASGGLARAAREEPAGPRDTECRSRSGRGRRHGAGSWGMEVCAGAHARASTCKACVHARMPRSTRSLAWTVFFCVEMAIFSGSFLFFRDEIGSAWAKDIVNMVSMPKGSAIWLPNGWTAALVSLPTMGGSVIVCQPYLADRCLAILPTCTEVAKDWMLASLLAPAPLPPPVAPALEDGSFGSIGALGAGWARSCKAELRSSRPGPCSRLIVASGQRNMAV